MRWNYISAHEGCDWLPCTVCGRSFPDPSISCGDIMYYPRNDSISDAEYEMIRRLWDVDPLSDFVVCEGCMAGHCGAVPGWTGDRWLARWERVWPLYTQLKRVGVRIVFPTHYPERSELSCLGCGRTYMPVAGRWEDWQCPNGCHKEWSQRRVEIGGSIAGASSEPV